MKLDSGAYMAELVRTRQGQFEIQDAVEWEEFVPSGEWENKVVKILSGGEGKKPSDENQHDERKGDVDGKNLKRDVQED